VLNISNAASAAGLEERTANAYVRLLEALFLLYRLPAWGRTLHSRSGAAPKIHVVDSGIAARMLRLTPDKLNRPSRSAVTEFGHLLETFVVGELVKQASWLEAGVSLGYWRVRNLYEVDLVVERDDGAVLGFEVKAGSRVRDDDLRGLRRLRDAVGPDFVAGAVLYTGEYGYTAEDRIHVQPIDRLWAAA
jgi:predicted AAA+ superfamily ATPase